MRSKNLIENNKKLISEWDFEKNIEINPSNISVWSKNKYWWKCKNNHSWLSSAEKRYIGRNCPFCDDEKRKIAPKEKSLGFLYPEFLKEWNYEKNINIDPYKVFSKSSEKYWWKCINNHEWMAEPNYRIGLNRGCPYCSNKILHNNNSLSFCFPEISNEWNYEKNKDLSPDKIIYGSDKKVWWKCKNGHEWKAKIVSRTGRGDGCPCCNNKKVCKENSLLHRRPEIAKEFDIEKNNGKTPSDFIYSSYHKVWWKCLKDSNHIWITRIYNRTNDKNPTNCPYCSGSLPTYDNNFARKFTELLKEWNFDLNNISPYDITPYSPKKVWWKCKKGHVWKATVGGRTISGRSCPYCANQKACIDNCLYTEFPEISKEFNMVKNYPKTPFDIICGSNKKYWWKCNNGHEWSASVLSRTVSKNGCPYCNKIELNDGEFFDSYLEAYYYLLFRDSEIKISHNKNYKNSKFKYDFYIPEIKTILEITSFNKDSNFNKKQYFDYIKKIVKKRKIAKDLGFNFQFIQRKIKKSEKGIVLNNIRRNKLCQ